MSDGRAVSALGQLAREAGAAWLASEAETLADRLTEGRFYVVCVGQFKRGKSTLLNALVEAPVLPTGIVPITAAVTVIRYGAALGARVRCRDRDWEECDPRSLATYVSEEHNPGNEKDVIAVEVFAPSPLLGSGMCLVDTPGIGSPSPANTAATRAFVPHIDAALVVLGADPPITGEELALVREVSTTVRDIIVVFNKADRQSDVERAEALRFTAGVLQKTVERPVGPILQVSATERLAREGPARDWDRLVARLLALARDSGAALTRAAEIRATTSLVERLMRELDDQREALLRPLEESKARVELLRTAVAEGERALADLGHLLSAEQDRLARRFSEERDRFIAGALPIARNELRAAIAAEPPARHDLRARALEHAREVTRRWLDRWREEQEARSAALYRDAERRFVELVNSFQERLAAVPGLESLPRLHVHEGFRARSEVYYTGLMHAAPASTGTWLRDRLLPWTRRRAIARDAGDYLERLLLVNSSRVKNDFEARVVQSRRLLEAEVRDRLRGIAASAEHALDSARRVQSDGASAVQTRLEWFGELRGRAEALRP
jgi:hypothetical protein